ncbi:MAG TPA: glycine cleavage system protein GcvH [Nitrososphaerales archaeon]|nr:glycine cleavage system protein GcvH [Nitrososphaerales archaeon]
MKFESYDIPDELLYTKEHEWAKGTKEKVRVGITDYAAKTLNDIVYVSLPKVGDNVKQLTVMGTIESIKAVSELYAPLSGQVLAVNTALETGPELVNKSPYSDGWLLEVRPSDFEPDKGNLLDSERYAALLEELSNKQHD